MMRKRLIIVLSIFLLFGELFPLYYAKKSRSLGSKNSKIVKRDTFLADFDEEDGVQVDIEDDGSDLVTRTGKRKIIIPVRKESLASKLLKTASSLQQTLSETSTKATQSLSFINRSIKAYFASDFESLLLQLTTPDDIQPLEKDVSTFLETTKSFHYNRDYKSANNPYRITLRKLWTKMIEDDIRTNLKALYLWHFLVKFSDKEDAMIYQKLITKMQKEKHKKTNSLHYDPNYFLKRFKIKSVKPSPSSTPSSAPYQQFLVRYYQYVHKRSILFTSGFFQLKQLSYQQSVEEICVTLCKGLHLLNAGMNCTPSVSEENELTLLAMELIAHDAYELFQDLKVKIQWLVQEDEVGDIFQNWSRKDIDSFLYYIKETFNRRYCVVHCYKPFFVLFRCDNISAQQIQAFIKDIAQVLELYNVEFPFSMDKVQHFEISPEEKENRGSLDINHFFKQFASREEWKAIGNL